MKYFALSALVLMLLVGATFADDCVYPGADPLTPEDVTELAAVSGNCCCYNNDIEVAQYKEVLRDENYCCYQYNSNCNTWQISIWREAEPTATEGLMNKRENGELVYTTVPEYTVDLICICAGGGGAFCYHWESIEVLYSFECEDCP